MRMPGQQQPSGRVWSEQQQAIFKAFREPAGHVLVRARAGCAKTTTSLEGAKQAPERRILVAAFNKLIVDEANAPLVGEKVVMVGAVGAGSTVARVTEIWEEYVPVWLLVSNAAMVA